MATIIMSSNLTIAALFCFGKDTLDILRQLLLLGCSFAVEMQCASNARSDAEVLSRVTVQIFRNQRIKINNKNMTNW